jgi:hypothetical protein
MLEMRRGQGNRHFQMSKANIMDMKAGSIIGRRERPVGVLRQAETRRADTGRNAHYHPSRPPRLDPRRITGKRRMKIDGHCHCGQIAFEAEVDPTALSICHCTDCQTLTGSAFRINIPAPAEHFVLRSGTPKSYVKTAESGNKRRHAFCGDCGTPIYACAVDNP